MTKKKWIAEFEAATGERCSVLAFDLDGFKVWVEFWGSSPINHIEAQTMGLYSKAHLQGFIEQVKKRKEYLARRKANDELVKKTL